MILLNYVTISVRGARLTSGAVLLLLRCVLRRRGSGLWLSTYIDAFTAPGASLFIARPAVAVADYALPIIHNFFTE